MGRTLHCSKTPWIAPAIGLATLFAMVAGCGGDAPPSPSDPDAVFELGTNLAQELPPAAYSTLSDGDEVRVVLGGQGAWMVVGAARTTAFPDGGKVTITASLEDAESGYQYAKVKFRRTLIESGDGSRFLTDAYLVLGKNGPDQAFDWEGREALLTVKIEESWGVGYEESRLVTLRTDFSE